MGDEIAIRINRELQNLIHSYGASDSDDLSLRLSRELANQLRAGVALSEAVGLALDRTPTTFFRTSRATKENFRRTLEDRLRKLDLGSNGLSDRVAAFCSFAERQLAAELWANRNDEGVLRSHLQTFLESRYPGTMKEVPTGRGRTDIALLISESKEVVETKLWKGAAYFEDGVVELAEYLRTEQLRSGYYVVLSCVDQNPLISERGTRWSETVDGRTIHVFFVRVSPASPSALGRYRR